MTKKTGCIFLPYNGYMLTLMDGEEVIVDTGDESSMENVVYRDGGVFYIDEGGCEICVDDVYDAETESHLNPENWMEECILPYYR